MQWSIKKIIRFGLYGTLFFPLFFTPFTYFSWHFGKTILFQAVVEILLVLALAEVFLGKEKNSTPWWKRMNVLDWSIVVFLAMLIVTAATGVNVANSFWGNQARANGVVTWLHFGVWYFLLKKYFSHGSWKKGLLINSVVSALVSATILFQAYLPASLQSINGGGIVGNRAFAAAYVLVSIGVNLYSFFEAKHRWRRLFLAVGALCLCALLSLGIRGAFVGLVAGLVVGFCFLLFTAVDKKKQRSVALGGLAGVVVCLGLLIFATQSSEGFRAHFPRLSYYVNIKQFFASTGETRLMAWKIALQGIKEKPIFGWGAGNYEVVFNKYFNPQFLQYSFAETVWDKPHNWLLEVGVSSGIVGVFSYLCIFASVLYCLVRKTDTEQVDQLVRRSVLKAILLAVFAAYFVQNLFLFDTTNSLLLFFFLLALVSCLYGTVVSVATVAPKPRGNWSGLVIGFCSLVLVFSIFEWHYLPLKSSYYLKKAHDALSGEVWAEYAGKTLAIPVGFTAERDIFLAERFTQLDKANFDITASTTVAAAERVAEDLEKYSEHYNDNPLPRVWAGQVYMALGEKKDPKYYVAAERNLLAAYKLSPQKQEFLFFLARLYLLKKDFAQAIRYNKEAVDTAPTIGISHWFLGLTYWVADKHDMAFAEIEEALRLGYSLTADQRLYVIDLYAEAKKYDKVIEWYKKLIAEDSENVTWYVRLATAYALAGNKPAALQMVEQAVKMYPPLQADAEKFIKEYKLK